MPDFGAPVAGRNQFDPNAGMQTLSSIMSLQRTQQALQSGALTIQQQQQNLERGAAETQQQQQTASQRQGIANIDWSKYDDGTGVVSTDKMLSDQGLQKAAGDQFLDVVKAGAAARQQQLQNKQSLVDLNDKLRGQFGSIVGALRTDPDVIADNQAGRQKVAQQIAEFGQAGGPDAQRVSQIYGPVVQHAPPGKLSRAISAIQLQAMDASRQAGAENPSYMSTGGSNVQVNPLAAGGAMEPRNSIPNTLAPQGGINPATGQPYVMGGAAGVPSGNGGTSGAGQGGSHAQNMPGSAAPGWPRLPSFPSPQQAKSASDASQEADAIRSGDSNPVSGYAPTKQVYSNLLNLVKQNPAIGPHSKTWNQLTGALTPFGASANSSMQEIDSYLDRLALQNAGAAGLSTDSARQMSAAAAGSSEMNPAALKEKLRFGAATLEASHAYRQGLDRVIGTDNSNPIAKRAFDAAWSQNADINAFRLLSAHNLGDTDGFNNTLDSIKKSGNAATVLKKYKNIRDYLMQGKVPPNE